MKMRRMTISEAALHLGVTVEAIRLQIRNRDLVACQTPEFKECVWIREISTNDTSIGHERPEDTPVPLRKDHPEPTEPQEVALNELMQQVADIRKRVEDLEANLAKRISSI